jgi:pimeloyl-ACP methyl ester carboxylesterase
MAYVAALERLLELGGAAAERRLWRRGDGGELHYLEAGSGPPVVLVQGGGGGAGNWYRVLGPLSREHRVLAPDLPGFGLSSPVEPERPLGMQASELLAGWLEGLGVTRYDVVGTSLGGLLALRLAQRWPERVRRLVLLSSAGLGRAIPWPVRVATLPGMGLALRPSVSGARWLFRRYLTTVRDAMSEAECDALVDSIHWSEMVGESSYLARSLRAFAGLGGQREVVGAEELGRLALPVLVCWGDRDRFFPERHGLRAARSIPGARFVSIAAAGHSPNWEAPASFLEAVLPFLAG